MAWCVSVRRSSRCCSTDFNRPVCRPSQAAGVVSLEVRVTGADGVRRYHVVMAIRAVRSPDRAAALIGMVLAPDAENEKLGVAMQRHHVHTTDEIDKRFCND